MTGSEFFVLMSGMFTLLQMTFAWVDRRRVASRKQIAEPIVLELSIVIDPTLQKQPTITAFAKQPEAK